MWKAHETAHEDGLTLRWLVLNGWFVLLFGLERNGKMPLARIRNSRESVFECRALFDPPLCARHRQAGSSRS